MLSWFYLVREFGGLTNIVGKPTIFSYLAHNVYKGEELYEEKLSGR